MMTKFFAPAFNLDAGAGAGSGAGGGSDAGAGAGAGTGSPPAAAGGGAQQPAAGSGTQAAAAAKPPANLQEALTQMAADGQQQKQDGAPPSGDVYRPQNLPEQFLGKTNQETIDRLAAEVAGRGQPPAKAADYKFEPDDAFKSKFGDLKDDPALAAWRDVAHDIGLPNDKFSAVVPKFFAAMEKAGLIEKPTDYAAERDKLADGERDPRIAAAKAAQRVDAVSTFLQQMHTRGVLSKADLAVLSINYANADTVMAFEKIMKLVPREHGVQGGGSSAGPQVTEHERAMRALFPTMANNS